MLLAITAICHVGRPAAAEGTRHSLTHCSRGITVISLSPMHGSREKEITIFCDFFAFCISSEPRAAHFRFRQAF